MWENGKLFSVLSIVKEIETQNKRLLHRELTAGNEYEIHCYDCGYIMPLKDYKDITTPE